MTTNEREDGRLLSSLRSQNGAGVVRIEDHYDADISDLWSALTDPDRLSHWYGGVQGDLRANGDFRLHVDSSGWDGTGKVELCEPPRRLLVTTMESEESRQEGSQPYEANIEATLAADGDQTLLVIEITGLPLKLIAFFGAGWQLHAEDLATYLAGGQPDGDVLMRFDALVPGYQALEAMIGSA
jgi:uncharacterized protein YndB with AHSA1/START domain